MKKELQNNIVSAVLMLVLGLLFLILKGGVIGIAMTVLGVLLIVQAVFDFIHKLIVPGVIKAVMGGLIISFGWVFTTAALYIMAGILLIYGVLQLLAVIRALKVEDSLVAKVVGFIQPAICLVISICLLFNQGGTVDVVFIVAGIFLIINSVLSLIECLSAK